MKPLDEFEETNDLKSIFTRLNNEAFLPYDLHTENVGLLVEGAKATLIHEIQQELKKLIRLKFDVDGLRLSIDLLVGEATIVEDALVLFQAKTKFSHSKVGYGRKIK